jgi:hypothetical protein
MSQITKSHLNSFQTIDFDLAHEEGQKLANVVRSEADGVTIYAGTHAQHGNIHIIIPPLGCGILLFPFAIRDFE